MPTFILAFLFSNQITPTFYGTLLFGVAEATQVDIPTDYFINGQHHALTISLEKYLLLVLIRSMNDHLLWCSDLPSAVVLFGALSNACFSFSLSILRSGIC